MATTRGTKDFLLRLSPEKSERYKVAAKMANQTLTSWFEEAADAYLDATFGGTDPVLVQQAAYRSFTNSVSSLTAGAADPTRPTSYQAALKKLAGETETNKERCQWHRPMF